MKAVALLVVGLVIAQMSTAAEDSAIGKESAARLVRLLDGTGLQYTKYSTSAYTLTFKGDNAASVVVLVLADNRTAVVEGIIAEHVNVVSEIEVMRRLLKANGAGGVTYMIDEDEDYVACMEVNYNKTGAAAFKSAIEAVASATDNAIGAVAPFLGADVGTVGNSASFSAPRQATARVELLGGKARVDYDPAAWKEEPTDETGRKTLRHVNGDAYALIISERLTIPLENLRSVALNNARTVAPDTKVVEQARRRVNGTDVVMLRMEGTASGLQFTYFGYYYGGKAGTIQVLTYTGSTLFDEYRGDFEALLNGFRVQQ
jgi:hypothetical protein